MIPNQSLLASASFRRSTAFDGGPVETVAPRTAEPKPMTGAAFGMTAPVPTDRTADDPLAWIDQPSADWSYMAPYWQKVGALMRGVEGLRAAKELYLPKFQGEDDKDYDYRLKTCRLTNVYRDIVESLSEKPFTEECHVIEDDPKPDERILEYGYDIDGAGNSLHVFMANAFFEAINNAIHWIMVDFPTIDLNDGRVRTQADDIAENVRPYWVQVPAISVLEARVAVKNGKEELVYVRILYPGERVTRVRVMERAASGPGATYSTYEKKNIIGAKWELIGSGPITIGVIPMVAIITGRRHANSFRVTPPLRDAADLQIEVFQAESGLKNTKTLAAYPMIAANGITPDKDAAGRPKAVTLGPNVILYGAPDGDGNSGSWERLAADAATMTFLREDVNADIQQLRELGRQPLTAQSGNVTRISAAMAAGKANSAVQSWALKLKDSGEVALGFTCMWLDIKVPSRDDNPKISIFLDFEVESDDDKSPEHLLKLREGSNLSQKTLWKEFKRRGILGVDFDPETEAEELASEGPTDADLLNDPNLTDPLTGLPKPGAKPPAKPGAKPAVKPAPKFPAAK